VALVDCYFWNSVAKGLAVRVVVDAPRRKVTTTPVRLSKDLMTMHARRSASPSLSFEEAFLSYITLREIATFFSKYHTCMRHKSGGLNMARRSKKEKAAGREQHRQLQRAKKMKKKQKKNLELPQRHRKKKN